MTTWVCTLDIADEWKKGSDGEINAVEFCQLVATKLKALSFPSKYARVLRRRNMLVKDFMVFHDEYADVPDELDFGDVGYLIEELYEWGDRILDDPSGINGHNKKVLTCRIKTI